MRFSQVLNFRFVSVNDFDFPVLDYRCRSRQGDEQQYGGNRATIHTGIMTWPAYLFTSLPAEPAQPPADRDDRPALSGNTPRSDQASNIPRRARPPIACLLEYLRLWRRA